MSKWLPIESACYTRPMRYLLCLLLLTGCACGPDVASVGATNAAFGNDPVTLAADMVAEAVTCE